MVLAHNINEGLRTQDVQISEDVTFDTMLLSPSTLEGLTNCGFYKPSPIQLHGIPLGKCGFDLLLEAKSGTGKTAVFTVIALEKLDLEKGVQTIILAPTREIAAQICDVISQIGSNLKTLNVEVVIGGLPLQEDIMKFKNKVHVVVGSPGRLRHLIQDNHIDVTAVRLLVLDEADKLMDGSFKADINYIFSVLPKEKQVIMSSATFPDLLKTVMGKYVQNAQHICPDSTTILLGIKQLVSSVKSNSNIVRQTQNRFDELLKILSKKNFKQCLIFCNYQVRVRDLYKMLLREKWPAEKLHSQQEQTDRLDALKMLQDYKCRILISTDLAARGIDASNVDLVINFEPPYEWQTYLHRIGRAGRFGSYGIAVTILSEGQEETKFKNLIKSINGSLDLKNFWDEEDFDLHEHDSSLNSLICPDIENNDAYHELIDKLTNGSGKGTEETESFESLCNSFEKTKESEIESFNDLLFSFKSQKENEDDPSNNSFNAESNTECVPTLNILNNALLKLNINTKVESTINSLRAQIKLLNSNQQNLKKREKEHSKPDKVHKANIELLNETIMNGAPEQNQEFTEDNNLYDHEFTEPVLNKALLDAGLPTSFGSSKCSNNIKKKNTTNLNYNENKQYPRKSNNIKDKEAGHKNKATPRERKAYNKQESEKVTTKTDSSSSEIDSKASIKNFNVKTKSRKYYNNNYCQGIRHPQTNNNWDSHTKYAAWYNQLKTQIEQIQMTLYIEELSKM
ncbi:hypothetical protein PYW07_013904 [Mythimna separata]|uniref:RNA helicase n=1 Tax=Mythimna separata TaxID=271217 RepID=A0AAD7YG05_MYTSE|nr:hypothetical protein PYW07_013904 [Mythimna separata]